MLGRAGEIGQEKVASRTVMGSVGGLALVEVDGDDDVGGGGCGRIFPIHDGLDGAFGEDGIAAQDSYLNHGSVGSNLCIEANDAADSRFLEDRGIVGILARDDFAARLISGLGAQDLRRAECQAEGEQSKGDSSDCRSANAPENCAEIVRQALTCWKGEEEKPSESKSRP